MPTMLVFTGSSGLHTGLCHDAQCLPHTGKTNFQFLTTKLPERQVGNFSLSLEFRCSGAVVKNESLSCNLVTVPDKAIRYFPCFKTLNMNSLRHQIQLVSLR